MSNINKIMEAYKSMKVSEQKIEEEKKPSKAEIHKVLGPTKNSKEGIEALMKAFRCDKEQAQKYLYSVMEEVDLELEEKKLDPVDDKENDKEFKDRKDKDIDNDGDEDSSDEYLHKKRAATDDAIDSKDDEEKKDIEKNPKTKDKKAEISKIESVDTREAFIAMWSDLEEAIDQKKGATAPEAIDSKESPKSKEFIAKHKKSDKKIENLAKNSRDTTFKSDGDSMKQASSRNGTDNLSNGDTRPVKGK